MYSKPLDNRETKEKMNWHWQSNTEPWHELKWLRQQPSSLWSFPLHCVDTSNQTKLTSSEHLTYLFCFSKSCYVQLGISNSQFKPVTHIAVCDEVIEYFGLLQMVKNKGKGLGKWIKFLTRCKESLSAPPNVVWRGTGCHRLVSGQNKHKLFYCCFNI